MSKDTRVRLIAICTVIYDDSSGKTAEAGPETVFYAKDQETADFLIENGRARLPDEREEALMQDAIAQTQNTNTDEQEEAKELASKIAELKEKGVDIPEDATFDQVNDAFKALAESEKASKAPANKGGKGKGKSEQPEDVV